MLSIALALLLCGACISAPRSEPSPIPAGMLDDQPAEDALHLPGTDRRWALEEPWGMAHEAGAPPPEASGSPPDPGLSMEAPEAPAPQTTTQEPPEEPAAPPAPSPAAAAQDPAAQGPGAQRAGTPPAAVASAAGTTAAKVKPNGPLRYPRGEGLTPIVVPRDERLLFRVYVSLGWFGEPSVGRVQLTSNVDPFRASALAQDAPAQARGERGVLVARAWGSHSFYELDETITTLLLPQSWPAVIHRTNQSGTENRRRELRMGVHPENGPRAWYRADRHCPGCTDRAHYVKPGWAWQSEKHCERCKRGEHRVWREPKERAMDASGAVDMLSAVLLARALIDEGGEQTSFLLLDKLELWEVTVTRGDERDVEVPAGRFAASQVILRTTIPQGEAGREEDFEGLFGIQGDISIWFERETGVPLQISGKVPAGPIKLEVSINLAEFEGTPDGFAPLR